MGQMRQQQLWKQELTGSQILRESGKQFTQIKNDTQMNLMEDVP